MTVMVEFKVGMTNVVFICKFEMRVSTGANTRLLVSSIPAACLLCPAHAL